MEMGIPISPKGMQLGISISLERVEVSIIIIIISLKRMEVGIPIFCMEAGAPTSLKLIERVAVSIPN